MGGAAAAAIHLHLFSFIMAIHIFNLGKADHWLNKDNKVKENNAQDLLFVLQNESHKREMFVPNLSSLCNVFLNLVLPFLILYNFV